MPLGIKEVVDAELEGRTRNYVWRKAPTQATTAGVWFDVSMSSGNPAAQYYVGTQFEGTILTRTARRTIEHGPNVAPQRKFIRSITTMTGTATALPLPMILCDYLMFYPLIDTSDTELQTLDNPTPLSRYADGKGVQVMAVLTNAGAGGQSFYFTYTNQDGVSGRVSQTVQMNASTATGTVCTSSVGTVLQSGNPFIGLQDGDSGVRSIQSVQMLGADVGLFALVLVKPLLWTQVAEATAPYEKRMFFEGNDLPRVYDDAYLNFLCLPRGTLSGTVLVGDLKVIWTD